MIDNVFFKILDKETDFDESLKEIKRLFFPQKQYEEIAAEELDSEWIPDPDERVKKKQAKFKKFIKQVCEEETLPFLPYFHELFLERQWNIPYDIPRQHSLDLVRLKPDQPLPQQQPGYNYSKNEGNYNHFVNVVAALARLIMYFEDEENVKKLVKKMRYQSDSLRTNQINEDEEEQLLADILKYNSQADLRKFKLILAGFYHDIGKSIQNPRHAMEGAIILQSHTTEARYKLHRIVKDIEDNWKFERDDLLFISDLVLYHDQYGTLSTGEDGYLQLVDVIDFIHRYSLKESSKPEERLEWSHKYLFDLWLLNVADIMVSIPPTKWIPPELRKKVKWIAQKKYIWGNQEEANKVIETFLFNDKDDPEKDKSNCLIHDLQISFELLDDYCSQKHIDDLTALKQKAHNISLKHVLERLRRLMISTLRKPIEEYKEEDGKIFSITKCIDELSDEEWNSSIVRAIEATTNREEFSRRFSWLKKSDYALGFFQKIVGAALKKIKNDEGIGWTYKGTANFDDNYLNKTQAQYIADNYVITVIQILGHLLFRDPSLDSPRNVEFSDATKRLTDNKINQILSFEGPSRTRKSIDLILQTIYVY